MPQTEASLDALVIGAGLAGLAAARDLQNAGYAVRVVEKSRGVGGRAATRRGQDSIMDHGAPCFTARGARLKDWVRQLEAEGTVRVWTHGFHAWQDGQLEAPTPGHPRFVMVAGMTALGKGLRDGLAADDAPLAVQTEALVTEVRRRERGWGVRLESGEVIAAHHLIVSAPAPQALKLVAPSLSESNRQALEAVQFQPCWAALVLLAAPPAVDWQGVKLHHPTLEWVGLEHTKRPGTAPAAVIHASAEWSQAHLEREPEWVAAQLLEAVRSVFGEVLAVETVTAHRWRYARANRLHSGPFLTEAGLLLCGDWCDADGHGSRVENALESGWAAAEHVRQRLETSSMTTV